jgi:hypothetical protein
VHDVSDGNGFYGKEKLSSFLVHFCFKCHDDQHH